MIVERSMNSSWLSNTYLVADGPRSDALLIDSGGPAPPIEKKIKELNLRLSHVLCTHHHFDHISNNDRFRNEFGAKIVAHEKEGEMVGHVDITVQGGEEWKIGELLVRPLHIPGHTLGQLAFLVNDEVVFTGDTLFRGSVGGTRGPGHTTFEDIRNSIMEVLMKLPKEMKVFPGHMEATTIGQEWENNPFIRAWRGLDPLEDRQCRAAGQAALLRVEGRDYDGGTKCWVTFEKDGTDDIVGGSQVSFA